jgi:hypothetical protein
MVVVEEIELVAARPEAARMSVRALDQTRPLFIHFLTPVMN